MILRDNYYTALFAYLFALEDFVDHFGERDLPPVIDAKRMRVYAAALELLNADQQ